MKIESTAIIAPDQADAAGRLLLAIAKAQRLGHSLHTADVTVALDKTNVSDLLDAGNALLALGNDTDAIIAPGDEPDDERAAALRHAFNVTHTPEEYIEPIYPETETPMFKSFYAAQAAAQKPDPKRFETATVYVSKADPDRWIFRAHYENDEVVKYFDQLEEGLREFSGDIVYFVEPEPDRYEVRKLKNTTHGVFYRVWSNSEGRYMDGSFSSQETAETWKLVLARAEGVPECDVSPESVLEIDAKAAGLVGELLKLMQDPGSWTKNRPVMQSSFARIMPRQLEEIADALLELSREKNVMIVQEDIPL
jgi:hypothetical protein